MSERPSDETTIDAAVASDDADGRAYRVKLPMFEGPLDLLLHLIQKHELNILEIPIGFVALKYVEYIRMMEEMSIDIASEYLVMAATLAYIKSRELLPPDPSQAADEAAEEEEEDPRAELIRKLLEYQKYKNAADNLGDREVLGRDVFARGLAPDQSDEEAPLAPMSLFKLVDAFEGVLKRAKQVQEHQIDFEKVSISDRVGQIVERLRLVRTLRFEQLFDGDITRPEMIVTFLALLEMTKLRMTRLTQDGPLGPIVVELVLSAEQVRNFDAERAFDSVHTAVEEDFAADKPWTEAESAGPAEPSPWEGNSDELELSEEELAEELREAAQAFALDEQLDAHESAGEAEAEPEAAGTDEGSGFDSTSSFALDEELTNEAQNAEGEQVPEAFGSEAEELPTEPEVDGAGQLDTFGPLDEDDWAGPEWDDAASEARSLAALEGDAPAESAGVSNGDAAHDPNFDPVVGEAAVEAGTTDDESGPGVDATFAPLPIAPELANPGAGSDGHTDGSNGEASAGATGDRGPGLGTPGSEPETDGDTGDLQEGSQDPRGSDVESP